MTDREMGRRFLAAAALIVSLSAPPLSGGRDPRLRQIPRSALCVTEGAVEESPSQGLPAQTVDATLACSLLAGVWKPSVFLGRWFRRSATWLSCA